ncbi:MAG TPA: hypothetical protein VMI56_03400 [Reyranella sp.]|nr:hypothetical protein [Reyranella sp.]
MRLTKLFSLGAAVAVSTTILAFSVGAQAEDHWDHRWDRDHYYHHERVVERPVYVAPRPVYVAPPPVVYAAPPAPSGLNLNFNIPLQ